MQFDSFNNVVQLCAEGMSLEGEGNAADAYKLFQQAWSESRNDFEKFTAAHYVARHQNSIEDKLKWDEISLNFALKIEDDNMRTHFPSLYLNIAKCYEDLKDFDKAQKNYALALSFISYLLDDGYGKMIKSGIKNGIKRTKH